MRFEERVKNSKLTITEKVVAEYVLHNYSMVGIMTTSEIAQKLNVSEASIVRMARSLGYDGFNDLKNEIKDNISTQLKKNTAFEYSLMTPMERFSTNEQIRGAGEVVEKLAYTAASSIEDVIQKNSPEAFQKCVDILLNSKRRYICGYRSAAFVADFFAFEALFMLENVILSTDADGKAIEKMVDISSEDCVILFAYPRYGKINSIIKQMAIDAGAKVIIVIDKLTSQLSNGVDVVLTCNPSSLSYYNSIIPMCFICEILIVEMSKVRGKNFERRSTLVGKYMDPAELY